METNALKIADFVKTSKRIICVKENDSLQKAVTLMMTYNYSQLPVISKSAQSFDLYPKKDDVVGFISWKTIGQTLTLTPEINLVEQCMRDNFQKVKSSAKLVDVTELIFEHDFVFVQNEYNQIYNVFTKEAMGKIYYKKGRQYILLEQIERDIRTILARLDLKKAALNCKLNCDMDNLELTDLSFGDYDRLLANKDNWGELKLNIDRAIFLSKLSEIRIIRNKIMHFREHNLSEEEQKNLENMSSFFRNLLKSFKPKIIKKEERSSSV